MSVFTFTADDDQLADLQRYVMVVRQRPGGGLFIEQFGSSDPFEPIALERSEV